MFYIISDGMYIRPKVDGVYLTKHFVNALFFDSVDECYGYIDTLPDGYVYNIAEWQPTMFKK